MAKATTKPSTPTTWIVGRMASTARIQDSIEFQLPEIVMVIDPEHGIRGFAMGKGEQGRDLLSEALGSAEKTPVAGPPGRPDQVHTTDEGLAREIRQVLAGVDVRVRPIPELDVLFAEVGQHLVESDAPDEPGADFLPEVLESHLAPFYQAAAAMYAQAPWRSLPEDRALVRVTAAQLGFKQAVVCLIGQLEESRGFLVFESLADFDMYYTLASPERWTSAGLTVRIPAHFALNYVKVKSLPAQARKRFKAGGHALAGPDAYPEMINLVDGLRPLPLGVSDLRRGEAVCRIISWLVDNEPRLSDASADLNGIQHRFRIQLGSMTVAVSVKLI